MSGQEQPPRNRDNPRLEATRVSQPKPTPTNKLSSRLTEDKEPLVVSITAAVKRDLKIAAAVRGETMTSLVESVLRDWLENEQEPA